MITSATATKTLAAASQVALCALEDGAKVPTPAAADVKWIVGFPWRRMRHNTSAPRALHEWPRLSIEYADTAGAAPQDGRAVADPAIITSLGKPRGVAPWGAHGGVHAGERGAGRRVRLEFLSPKGGYGDSKRVRSTTRSRGREREAEILEPLRL